MDERTPIEGYEEPPTRPLKRPGRLRAFALLLLLICLLEVGLFTFQTLVPPPQRSLPVTGGGAGVTQPPRENLIPAHPPAAGADYRQEMEDRLSTCMVSFHEFFLLQELATRRNDIFSTETWRKDGSQAMDAFLRDCEQLGELPSAPPIYTEVDRWLKLAADEVSPAADSFRDALGQDGPDGLTDSMSHLIHFIEFTRNAQSALYNLKNRREL